MGAQRVVQTMGPNSLRVLSAQKMSVALRPVSNLDNHVTLLQTDLPSSVIGATSLSKTHSQAYTPYGFCAKQSTDAKPAFNGQWLETVLGGYFLGNGYRFYNTTIMRFHNPDTMSPFGKGGVNAYAYCQGDPVNYQDPTGHFPGLYLDNYISWLSALRNTPTGGFKKRLKLKDTLDDKSNTRLIGYYFEAETKKPIEFRVKSIYMTGEYRNVLGISNHTSRNTSSTHVSISKETFKPGKFMLKDNIALSGISTDGKPATFDSLAPFREELIEIGFQETTIGVDDKTDHQVTEQGFIQNQPKQQFFLPQTWMARIRK
ncbi:hypothetical protein HB4184_24545 [Pseudomonas putida]|nr:hypothetical protein HB4184_24545 [Pseudomonas putida]